MFVADFPGLTMDNYITPEMDNVTLTVLVGSVRVEQQNGSKVSALTQGQSVRMESASFHKVTTISEFPSCFFYTFINATQQLNNVPLDTGDSFREWQSLSLTQELQVRVENYKKFFYHVANGILFEFYGVPMPRRRLRAIHDA